MVLEKGTGATYQYTSDLARIELSTRDCLTLLLFLSAYWLLLFLSACWLLLRVFLSTCCFMSRVRMFHSHGVVTIPSQGLPDFGIRSAPRAFEQALNLIVPHLL